MNDKQVAQSEIAALIKLIQFERNRPTLTHSQLLELREKLQEALNELTLPKK
jgi:hypothetical protein